MNSMNSDLNFMPLLKRLLIILFLFICYTHVFGQHKFKNGYFVTNSNDSVECFILDEDWDENPISFKFKLSTDGVNREASIDSIKCFGISDASKYIRKEVEIDLSSDKLEHYSYQKAPEYEIQILFLKVLVEGDRDLYHYKGQDLSRFFIHTEEQGTIQLIYKDYYAEFTSTAVNESFRGQLCVYLQCDSKLRSQIMNMRYSKRNLIKLFKSYESQAGNKLIYYQENRKGEFKVNINAGIVVASSINSKTSLPLLDFKHSEISGYSFGTEVEYFFPVKNNKLSLLIEPSLLIERSDFPLWPFYVDYYLNQISVPIGIRNYIYISSKNGFFYNVGGTISSAINSGLDFYSITADGSPSRSSKAYELQFSNFALSMFVGIGYRYKDVLVEFRYSGFNKNLTYTKGSAWVVKHSNTVFKASYSFDLSKKEDSLL